MIGQFQSLGLMGACLLITLPLELVLGARAHRRIRGLQGALLPVLLIFSVWDIANILRDVSYNPRFVTGIHLAPGIPVGELTSVIAVSVCGLLAYEAVGQVPTRVRVRSRRPAETPRRG